jgi:hypothetical protein
MRENGGTIAKKGESNRDSISPYLSPFVSPFGFFLSLNKQTADFAEIL